jgi:hypothetical protein
VTARRDGALATLHRLGVDATAVDAGTIDDATIERLLTGPEADAATEALAEIGGERVAVLLAARARPGSDRALLKALRRALFRFEQRGVPVPRVQEAAEHRAAVGGPDIEGFISAFDGRGARILWLLRPQSGGGTLLLAAEVHEPEGLRDVRLTEMTRKELRAVRDRLQREAGLRLVPTDWRVVDALLVEAHERAGAPDRARDYLRLRPRLVTVPPKAPAEPVSALVTTPSDDERTRLVATSDALLGLPELQWWPAPEAMAPFLDEIAAVRDSPLVLSELQQEERLRAILARAAAQLYPPSAMARRLEGTAYVLAGTGRVSQARQALAVAEAVRAGASADQVPYLRLLVQQAMGAVYAAETSRRTEERRGSLVITPGEALRDSPSSRPGRTRA